LLAKVHAWNLPHFFLTLTCDEVTKLRWDEYDTLDDFMSNFNEDASWKDCPVECARLFHDRVTAFMKEHILSTNHPVLGDVKHFLLRYESQHRGSLHAHILLWIDPMQIDAISQEICPSMLVRWEPDPHTPGHHVRVDPMPDTPEADLLQLVQLKQMHQCRFTPRGCRDNNRPCSYKFPYPTNHAGTIFNTNTGHYDYFRFNSANQWIVPYHPTVLLLWRAHMNIQRITDTQWRKYILKYATKIEPQCNLRCDRELVQALGLHGLSPHQQDVVGAAILSKPVSPAEAALIMLNIPIIQGDASVAYVDTHPPPSREVMVSGFSRGTQNVSDVARYLARPDTLKHLKFRTYFEKYEVRPLHHPHSPRQGTYYDNDQ
jgi:hypothetical protein